MKLFKVTICCDSKEEDVDTDLIPAENKDEAEEKMKKNYSDFMKYFQWVEAVEITSVYGWKIVLEQDREFGRMMNEVLDGQ